MPVSLNFFHICRITFCAGTLLKIVTSRAAMTELMTFVLMIRNKRRSLGHDESCEEKSRGRRNDQEATVTTRGKVTMEE